ncbi:YbjN domain-containing protein [Parvicella tangerina]|uniref:TY-Chap central domain-containing protein n=1 Tax=Parvicella tangerina TaxID=2829795 RepID=A0A916NC98_9FLAO|nr:YbjN domain-containing protein [Parvicella tangerina]CAG5084755.1 hypothetical protein CRYO30217_02557 [Parvicella tangerina]
MPKFKVLHTGENQALIDATYAKIDGFMKEMFHEDEVIKIDDLYSFSFGTVTVNIIVRPWHSEDVLVDVFSYLAEEVELDKDQLEELLRMNATIPFGSFGISMENAIKFSYTLAGKNMDKNEFSAAIQNIAAIADQYDEQFEVAAS